MWRRLALRWRRRSVPKEATVGQVGVPSGTTVCGDAAGEVCPIWPGHPVTGHWGIEVPSHVQGIDVESRRAFVTALRYLENRITLFAALPIEKLETSALTAKVREIGQTEGASSPRSDVA